MAEPLSLLTLQYPHAKPDPLVGQCHQRQRFDDPLLYDARPRHGRQAVPTACSYTCVCTGGQVELRVIYFTTGSCPTGTQQYCSNLRATPFGLTLSSYSCSPFSMTFLSSSSGCPTITNSGYTQFTITL